MNIKKLLPYVGALLLAVAAIIGLVKALGDHTDTPDSWGDLASSVAQVKVAADAGTAASVASKDFEVCVATSATSALAGGVADSLNGVKDGVCHIPDVSLDVSACLALKAVEATPVVEPAPVEPAPEVVETPAVEPAPEAVAADPAESVEAVVPPVTEPVAEAAPVAAPASPVAAVVEGAVAPLLAVAQGALAKSDASPEVKAWATAVVAWLQSGVPSVVALIENPGEGKLSFKGVDVEGCKP